MNPVEATLRVLAQEPKFQVGDRVVSTHRGGTTTNNMRGGAKGTIRVLHGAALRAGVEWDDFYDGHFLGGTLHRGSTAGWYVELSGLRRIFEDEET